LGRSLLRGFLGPDRVLLNSSLHRRPRWGRDGAARAGNLYCSGI